MATRIGKTIILESEPGILSNAAIVGKKEGEGPLGKEFDTVYQDATMGEDSWEKAESTILKKAVEKVIEKSDIKKEDIDCIFAGDLLNQCTSSAFALADTQIPFCGLYGACSTMALSLIMGSLAIESGAAEKCICATSSHFCSSEKQFRMPLEYGGQRPPTAQWTVTGAGAVVLQKAESAGPYIEKVHLGTIQDFGVTDATNMGAAMAPAAAKTIRDFLSDTATTADDYDLILTGDLGSVGSKLLIELLQFENGIDISKKHNDCGLMIFDTEKQDVHAGGSGCGCSAAVLCSHILNKFRNGEFKNILFVATGALMSSVSSLQGRSIPGVAHLVNIRMKGGGQ